MALALDGELVIGAGVEERRDVRVGKFGPVFPRRRPVVGSDVAFSPFAPTKPVDGGTVERSDQERLPIRDHSLLGKDRSELEGQFRFEFVAVASVPMASDVPHQSEFLLSVETDACDEKRVVTRIARSEVL